MQFTSYSFALFAAILLLVYYLVPGRWQWMILLGASYVFYLWAGPEYLIFILLTTVSTYITARVIDGNLQKQDAYLAENKATISKEDRKALKAAVKRKNRIIMTVCLVLNFTVLAFCKGCLLEPLRSVLQEGKLSFLTLGLPMGISFYMFQSMGYVVDVQRGTVKAERNIARLALFVSFFPQLIQGPISRYKPLVATLYGPHKFDRKQVSFGLQRMLWGFFKKLVVADRIAAAVGALKGDEFSGMAFAVLMLFYAIQIYGDFTGGIDVALGIAQALGVVLPENFNRPYFSKSVAEFWRRWHITLGAWLREYVFYPISISGPMRNLSKASQKVFGRWGRRVPLYVASIITWLVTGIWHGATWGYVVWGLLNCVVIVISEELEPLYEKFHNRFSVKKTAWYGCFEILRTFCLTSLIRVSIIFSDVGSYFRHAISLFTTWNPQVLWDGTLMNIGLTGLDYGILGVSVALMFGVSLYQETKGSFRELLWGKCAAVRWIVFFVLFLLILLMGCYGIGYDASSFIYNRF